MKIKVKVQPQAKKNLVVEENGRYKVYLTAPPIEGKANKALVDVLADHFNIKRKNIKIISGLRSKEKSIEILG